MRNSLFTSVTLYLLMTFFGLQVSSGQSALSIIDYGATPNDNTDDTQAIKNTIAAAKTQGKEVYIPTGTFRYTSFRFNGITVSGDGPTSILYAPDQLNSQVIINGNGAVFKNLKIQTNGTSRTYEQHNVYVESATNFMICNVEVVGSTSAAILMYKSSFGKIINNYVHNTFSDGIHSCCESHDIIVDNNKVRFTGDDLIACVSYGTPATKNILIQNNDVAENDWGRGISSIGGSDITIQNNTIGRTGCCAGIIVATEPSFTSPPLSNVLIKNNQLTNNSGSTGHGSFLISGLNGNIDKVRFEGNTISNPVHDAIKLEGDVSNVSIIGTTITSSNNKGINILAGTNIYCANNTLNGSATSATKCTGVNNFNVTGSSLTYTNIPCTILTGIEKNNANQIISPIYPNPANNVATFGFNLKEKGSIKIILYDVLGNEKLFISNENQSSGQHNLDIDTSQLQNGIYIAKININNIQQLQKLIISK